MSAKVNLLEFFLKNVGQVLSRDNLSKVAGVHDWQRIIRSLRQEGWNIESNNDGYKLHSTVKSEKANIRVGINNKLRYAILQRDNSKCRRCGKTIEDNVKLEIDHKIPVEWGGDNNADNLWTLCNECNGGKKHFFSDFDQKIMTEVLKESSGYQKLLVFFQLSPNVIIEPLKLDVISGIRDWTRTLRLIRKKEGLNIVWVAPSKEHPNGGYILEN